MMLYVKYRLNGTLKIAPAGETLETAETMASYISEVAGEIEILIDLASADETARAMAFTPPPLLPGVVGYGTWREEAPGDSTDVSDAAIAGIARRTTEE